MSDEGDNGRGEGEQGGVFGKLPASRPGTRSPRRDSANRARSKRKPAAKRKPRTAAGPKPAAKAGAASRPVRPAPASAAPPERPPATASGDHHEGGLDDLAWAGVAAAAGVATAGVRFASRAIEALRGGNERS